MFIGHLPAAYILTKKIQSKFKTDRYLLIGLLAGILPDLDLFYFYLIDNKQNLHHSYWTHIPFYWLIIAIITVFTLHLFKKKAYTVAALIFFSNIFLHLTLDTIVGKVEWLYPLTNTSYYLFNVPAIYDFWVYNFIFHWTFLLEIGVIVWAIYLSLKQGKRKIT